MNFSETLEITQRNYKPFIRFYTLRKLFHRLLVRLEKTSDRTIWLSLFFYSSAVAVLVQFLILPYIIPRYHAGHGILLNSRDLLFFHLAATEQANLIKEHGWKVLEVMHWDHSHVMGIIYALTTPEPWVLIPFQAALHASSAFLLFRMAGFFTRSRLTAILSFFPFFFFPTPMFWYTQTHREGIVIFGVFLFIYGWMTLAFQAGAASFSKLNLVKSVFYIFFALPFLICGRPYMVQIVLFGSYMIAPVVLGTLTFASKQVGNKFVLRYAVLFAGILFLLGVISKYSTTFEESALPVAPPPAASSRLQSDIDVPSESENPAIALRNKTQVSDHTYLEIPIYPKKQDSPVDTQLQPAEKHPLLKFLVHLSNPRAEGELKWYRTRLPLFIETRLFTLMAIRDGYRHTDINAPTNIDIEIRPQSVLEILAYLPRVLQIGLFAPFPDHWNLEGTKGSSKILRFLANIEMAITSLILPFIIGTALFCRRRLLLFVLMSFNGLLLSVFTLVITNVGTLHRIRYGFLMAFVALGIVGIQLTLESMKERTPV